MPDWELKKKYRIIHIHSNRKEGIIALCLEPLEKLTPPQGAIASITTMGQTAERRLAQETVGAIMRHLPSMERPRFITIEMTVGDYEKLGKPGILEEATLTLTTEEGG